MLKGNVKVTCDECGKVLAELEDITPDDVSYDDTAEGNYLSLPDGVSIICNGKSFNIGYGEDKHFCNEVCLATTLKKFFATEVKAVGVKKNGDKKRK
jgi:hypothetical protein